MSTTAPWAPDQDSNAAQGFASYMALVYPDGTATKDQRDQVEQAFMAGLAWVLARMLKVASLSEDEGVNNLQALQDELLAWNLAKANAHLRDRQEAGHG